MIKLVLCIKEAFSIKAMFALFLSNAVVRHVARFTLGVADLIFQTGSVTRTQWIVCAVPETAIRISTATDLDNVLLNNSCSFTSSAITLRLPSKLPVDSDNMKLVHK